MLRGISLPTYDCFIPPPLRGVRPFRRQDHGVCCPRLEAPPSGLRPRLPYLDPGNAILRNAPPVPLPRLFLPVFDVKYSSNFPCGSVSKTSEFRCKHLAEHTF